MKIGVFGGSFNPIHIGHCIVASHILQSSELDEVWLNVSPQNPLKAETSDAMSQHRLNMARLAIDGCDGLKVCDVEFHMPVPSYTISTLRELKRIYPDHDFKLIIGSDNWLIFDRWRAFDEIIADFGVVIYPRPGFPLPPDKTLPDNVEIVKAPEIELSSTHIRHCAKKGLDLHFLLPDKVREYIMFNNLYKN